MGKKAGKAMKKLIDFLGGCCVTLFFLVTYQIMHGINFFKDYKAKVQGFEGASGQAKFARRENARRKSFLEKF
jgi:hypothetical protein